MDIPHELYRQRGLSAQIIAYAVFLYRRFALSLRDEAQLTGLAMETVLAIAIGWYTLRASS
ncbi:MAG: hypothetical protein ACI8PT_003461, partial [Gammaproteobacteria bacterium]